MLSVFFDNCFSSEPKLQGGGIPKTFITEAASEVQTCLSMLLFFFSFFETLAAPAKESFHVTLSLILIFVVVLKLLQLRILALDLCDACDGGFDSPSVSFLFRIYQLPVGMIFYHNPLFMSLCCAAYISANCENESV